MKKHVKELLLKLEGCALCKVHRAGNISVLSWAKDKSSEVVFSLHFQCSWRLRRKNEILLAWSDFSLPASFVVDDQADWEAAMQTRFDEQASVVTDLAGTIDLSASFKESDVTGGFCLKLGQDILLEVFPSCSELEEFWRLLDWKTKEHFVVFDV